MIVGVTGESVEDVEPFLAKHKPQYPIVIGQAEDYDVTGIPESFLIDKDGKILWRGHPARLDVAKLDAALVGAKARVGAKGLEEVTELRRKGEHGAAWQKAKEALAKGALFENATRQANEFVAATEAFVAESMAAADSPQAAKDAYFLWGKLEPVATRYQGVPGAEAAVPRLEKLLANAKAKRDIEAGQKFTEAAALEAKMQFDAAYDLYKELASRFGSSRSGRAGNDAYRRLEKEGKLGYDASCPYCKAKGGACPQHLKKKR